MEARLGPCFADKVFYMVNQRLQLLFRFGVEGFLPFCLLGWQHYYSVSYAFRDDWCWKGHTIQCVYAVFLFLLDVNLHGPVSSPTSFLTTPEEIRSIL